MNSPPLSPAGRQRWLLAAGLVLLLVSHPQTWGHSGPALWYAPLGLGIALTAWLGRRGALLVAAGAFLAGLRGWLAGTLAGSDSGWLTGVHLLAEAGLEGLLVWAAWWAYARASEGGGSLGDPRWASVFVVFVPGLAAGFGTLLRLGLEAALGTAARPFAEALAAGWLGWALGILALAPVLLFGATPWLVRRGLVERRLRRFNPDDPPSQAPTWGDRLEIAGLAAGTATLGLLLAVVTGGGELPAWPLWGMPLLFIVWASLRQGVRGGTTVAAAAALLCLLIQPLAGPAPTPLQGNLLAQCITGLLVGASVSWIRGKEARYRQVVGHIPVILYSARLRACWKSGPFPGGEITFVSPASRVVLGCAPDRLLGDYARWLRRVHPQDHELITAALGQLRLAHRPVTCEYRLAPEPEGGPPETEDNLDQLPTVFGLTLAGVRWVRDTLVPHISQGGELEGWEGVVEDITAQRALASDLRRTTNMLHALIANLPAGVFFVHGPTGQPLLVNARARQLLGQREDSAAGLPYLSQVYRLFRPDGTPYPAEDLPVSRALRSGVTSMRDDIVVHRPDGRRLPLITWAAPIDLGGPGKHDAAVWVFEDLTAVQQAETARLESETRLRAVIGTMAEGLLVQDVRGTVVECNPAACAILGVGADQLLGRSFPGADQPCLREDGSPFPPAEHPAQVSLKTGQPVRGVVMGILQGSGVRGQGSGVRGQGSGVSTASLTPDSCLLTPVRWILVNAMPLPRPEQGGPAQVVTTFADITAHRHALEVLRVSEEKYRRLVENLPLMLIQIDRQAHLEYVNPATQAVTGYDLDELRSPEAWQAIIHPEDLPQVQAMHRDALAGQTGRGEVRYRAKGGAEKVCYAMYQPRRQGDAVIGVTILALDVTLQRHLEKELERARRLELVGRLASGIAHDFNNMLTVILTLTDLAQTNLEESHPVRRDLQRISEAGEQATRLAQHLLAFGKQRPLVTRRLDVNPVTAGTLNLLRSTLPGNITVEARLAPEPVYVEADETQLQRVLMNLCLNARDAMPGGGCIAVQTAAADEPGGWVRLSVRDTGHGMDRSVQTRIFDPFFSTKERGTGLGLEVVQQVIESFGGRVEVWSEPGQGTRFDIWLPRSEPGSVHRSPAVAVSRSPSTVPDQGAGI
jgi:PAS domain S-box-containing protein